MRQRLWSGMKLFGFCSSAALICACSQGADDTSLDQAVETQAEPLKKVVLKGRTYKLRQKLAGAVAPATGIQEPQLGSVTSDKVRDLREMTIDEVAAVVTPILISSDGHEYTADQPDYELAKKIKKELKEDDEAAAAQAAERAQAEREGRILLGPTCANSGTQPCDDRTYNGNNTVLPQSAFLFSELGCTATMISRGVAITAAHCVYETGVNQDMTVNGEPGQGNQTRRPRYMAGVDGRDADPFPFVHNYFGTYEVYCTAGTMPNCTNTNTTTPGRGLGCYFLAVPQGYRDLTGEGPANDATIAQHDYAFVDFGNCPWTTNDAFPGWQTGLLNADTTVTRADADDSGVSNLWGYPGSAGNPAVSRYRRWWADPVGGGNLAPNNQTAEIWGMTGTSSLVADNSVQVSYDMDTTGGQSGSSNWRMLNNVRRIMSIHRGASNVSGRNWGRRVDATVRNFGQTATTW